MGKKVIVLHIGLYKTATTSIQETLYCEANEEILNINNITYLKRWGKNNSQDVFSLFCEKPEKYHENLKLNLTREDIDKENVLRKYDLVNELTTEKTLIISGEDICRLNYKEVKQLKKFILDRSSHTIEFKIIFCTRSPIGLGSSLFQQTIKNGVVKIDDDTSSNAAVSVCTTVINNSLKGVRIFSDVFGKQSMCLYSFEEACKHKYGPVGYFFEKCGLDYDTIEELKQIRSNESFAEEAVKLNMYINSIEPMLTNGKMSEIRFPTDIFALFAINGNSFNLDKDILMRIFENLEEDINWLKSEYQIDYTEKEKLISKIKYNEHYYTEESVVEAFGNASDFIKECMISFYRENNKNLSEILYHKLIVERHFSYIMDTLKHKNHVTEDDVWSLITNLNDNVLAFSQAGCQKAFNEVTELSHEEYFDISRKLIMTYLGKYKDLSQKERMYKKAKKAIANLNADIINNSIDHNCFDNSVYELIYSLKETPTEFSADVSSIKYLKNKLTISSIGVDPFFILPNFENKNKTRLYLNISISTNVETYFEVYYAKNGENFDIENRAVQELQNGINKFCIMISFDKPIDKLRFDIGNIQGDYIIENIDIYA